MKTPDQLLQDIDDLKAAAEKMEAYVEHPWYCQINITEICTCGLKQARAEYKAVMERVGK